jgi:REP element-mobilizing transposase RayT
MVLTQHEPKKKGKEGMFMATHSHVRVYIHLVWGTYKRERVLNPDIRLKLFDHLTERADVLGMLIEKMYIQPEHLHILYQQPLDKTLPEIPKNLKGESSHWINDQNFFREKFRWQRGYGAYSVSESLVDPVKYYIENQEEHHRRKTFVEEYKEWAMKYGVWNDGDEI